MRWKMQKICEERKNYIDFLKVISIILVVFNHTGNAGYLAFQWQDNILLQIIELSFSIFCKIAVPIFFMCSGVLLLGKEESIVVLLKKRIIKIVFVILVFEIIYYVFLSVCNGSKMDLAWILKTIYSSTTFSFSGSYWFLYSYLAFLIMLPIFRIIANYLNKDIVIYIFVLYTVFRGVLPILEIAFNLEKIAISVPFATSQVFFYPLIGFYIEKNDISFRRNRKLAIVTIIMMSASVLLNMAVLFLTLKEGIFLESYMTILNGYLVVFIFILVREIFCKINILHKLRKIFQEISSCTFGIYLLHGFVFAIIGPNRMYTGVEYVDAWITVCFVLLVTFLTTYILRRLPIVKAVF